MDRVGLAGWTENKRKTLSEYSGNFNLVEVDNTFYRLQSQDTVRRWSESVPDNFQFLVKANFLMTKHSGFKFGHPTEEKRLACFPKFAEMIAPMKESGKLKSVLFQMPPSFRYNEANLDYLRQIRSLLPDLPLSVELRNPTWFETEAFEQTKQVLSDNNETYVVTDEPHNADRGAPMVPAVTTPDLAYVRLHGENYEAWMYHKGSVFNYDYSDEQLENIAKMVSRLNEQANEVAVIFNNTAGHFGLDNALQLKFLLNQNS